LTFGVDQDVLVRAFVTPDAVPDQRQVRAWETIVRHARETKLLGTLDHLLQERRQLERVPAAALAHLRAGRLLASAQDAAIRRELREIDEALRSVNAKVVLLKGAAYLAAGLPCARGRLFSDVDILVPKPDLPRVEAALMLAGYATTHHDPYDQRYYRKWAHELPPMQHVKRGTVVDVHHTIVPPTSRTRLNAAALFDAATPAPDMPPYFVLAPTDMVLHSATHLFNNEDMAHALRDLTDIDQLLRHFAQDAAFWTRLCERAAELDLWRPLYYALHCTRGVLETAIPVEVFDRANRQAGDGVASRLTHRLLRHALRPSLMYPMTRWARRLLYLRGHWLKMPLPLLAWHLTVKALRREEKPA
jgi:hypothetical protein